MGLGGKLRQGPGPLDPDQHRGIFPALAWRENQEAQKEIPTPCSGSGLGVRVVGLTDVLVLSKFQLVDLSWGQQLPCARRRPRGLSTVTWEPTGALSPAAPTRL